MRKVAYNVALAAIENENVVLLLTGNNAPSRLLAQRMKSVSRVYSERGYVALSVEVDDNCADQPELAAVRLPQIRVFESGEMTKKLVGTQEEDVLVDLVE